MIGQMLMTGMDGTLPSPRLLARVGAGHVGGIILYSENISPALPTAVRQLQAAAARGGNPPLLISTDQEGGQIKRFPQGPPLIPPPRMGDAQVAAAEGERTGRYLRQRGVNLDLAPVSDVRQSSRSFLLAQGRGFRGSPAAVGRMASAFAHGLRSSGVAACAKHFPGIGALSLDTDFALQQVPMTESQLNAAVLPFRAEIQRGVDMVMVANAIYPVIDPQAPAGFSPRVIGGLLRRQLGFTGVVISDALDSPSGLPGDAGQRAVAAARAGADIALFKPTADGPVAYERLLSAARSGALERRGIEQSYSRILDLKRAVAGRAR